MAVTVEIRRSSRIEQAGTASERRTRTRNRPSVNASTGTAKSKSRSSGTANFLVEGDTLAADVPPSTKRRVRSANAASAHDIADPIAPVQMIDELKRLDLEYVDHASFAGHPESAIVISYESAEEPEASRPEPGEVSARTAGLPAYLASLYEVPLLGKQREVDLFLKMNYFRWKAVRLRDQLVSGKSRLSEVEAVQTAIRRGQAVRNEIMRANLRLVVSIAKKHSDANVGFDELVSEGNIPLLRAVELFDISRGFRFSTYATWAIRNHLRRYLSDRHKHRGRFLTGVDTLEEPAAEERAVSTDQESRVMRLRSVLTGMIARLSDRERQVIGARFGLDSCGDTRTLSDIGRDLGISKERVRQLALQAVSKLQNIVSAEDADGAILIDAAM